MIRSLSLQASTTFLALLAAFAGLAGAGPPPPSRTASPPAVQVGTKPGAAGDIPESYRKVLATLRERRVQDGAGEVTFRLRPLDGPAWPRIRLKEIRSTVRGLAVILEDDSREYRGGDLLRGARLLTVTNDEATVELDGERRTLSTRKTFPEIAVRTVRQVEGEWAVFLEGERRAFYTGDTHKGARIARIDPDGVTFQYGSETRKLAPRVVRAPFPAVAFTGIIDMAGGCVALVKGRSDPLRVGDSIVGARIVEITPTQVVLEFMGELRAVPIR